MHFGFAFTVKDNKMEMFMSKKSFNTAFTMAEILLSLTIIGVVAAITLPSLTGNINERTCEAQRKALHSRITQALSIMGNTNGYGNYTYTTDDEGNINVASDNATMTFVKDGLAKVLKINNICDKDHFNDCGIVPSYKKFKSSTSVSFPKNLYEMHDYWADSTNPHRHINTSAVAFETANGESIVAYYNPFCAGKEILYRSGDRRSYFMPYMCVNFIFDLNGKKGPNAAGKDIWFITALYQNNLDVVMFDPNRISENVSLSGMTYDSFSEYCASVNARIATKEEVIASAINSKSAISLAVSQKTKGGNHFSSSTWVTYIVNGEDSSLYEYLTNVTGIQNARCLYREK